MDSQFTVPKSKSTVLTHSSYTLCLAEAVENASFDVVHGCHRDLEACKVLLELARQLVDGRTAL